MKIRFWKQELKLAHQWTVATGLKTGGKSVSPVIFVELTVDGITGIGEAAPPERYGETADKVEKFLARVEPRELAVENITQSMNYLQSLDAENQSAKGAINSALLDLQGKREGKPIYDLLELGFQENKHVTSFSIGIDRPDIIRKKVEAAASFPVLKLKVGSPQDAENLRALREVAPTKRIRVDANEGWKTPAEALRQIESLMQFGPIEFVEQPMPASVKVEDWIWLKERSPLPLFGDESYHGPDQAQTAAQCFHGVNVKLVKSGGITGAFHALRAARQQGLQTMIGCMIESSVLITAAAHLAELADHLDIDGNLLITNDPYLGASANEGKISFLRAPATDGLRVVKRNSEN